MVKGIIYNPNVEELAKEQSGFPIVLFLPIDFWLVTICPILTFIFLYRLMKHRLQGYTGDCCGATFLLCELSFYLGAAILLYAHIRYGNPDFINAYLK